MLAVFGLGGWEILLILAVLGMMVAVPLGILAIVLFIVRRQKQSLPPPATGSQTQH